MNPSKYHTIAGWVDLVLSAVNVGMLAIPPHGWVDFISIAAAALCGYLAYDHFKKAEESRE